MIYVFIRGASGGKHLTPKEREAIRRARRRRLSWKPVSPLPVEWSVGPGFSYKLGHIYVDGALVDESAHGGSSLGFTLWGGPALAVIRRGLAVGVAADWHRAGGPPTVWLMTPNRGE